MTAVKKEKIKIFTVQKRGLIASTVEQKLEMDVNNWMRNNIKKVTVKSIDFSVGEEKGSVMVWYEE